MNEIDFRNWLINTGKKPKIACDVISRLKRIEKEIDNCDIDEHYYNDRCNYLLCLFKRKGQNDEMSKLKCTNFPIGKYCMNTYRYALKQYIMYLEFTSSNNR